MHRRMKMKGLVSRTEPSGKSFIAKSVTLRKKYLSGDITEEELWELVQSGMASDLIVSGEIKVDTPVVENKFKTICIWGKEIKVTVEEHNVHSTLICD